MTTIGKGIEVEVKDGKVTLTFDVESDLGLSASGKSRMVATTSGNIVVPGTDIKLGLNAYRAA